jgi:hypothetical protein
MKILKCNYKNGEALIVFEEFPKRTYCVPLDNVTTVKDVTDNLKSRLPSADALEEKFNNLNLKSLEGSDVS